MGRHPGTSRGAKYMSDFKPLIARLNVELAKIQGATMKGLINSTAYIYKKTESEAPLTPVDTGNMRASWFVVTASGVPVGRKLGQFVGENSGRMSADHTNALSECQGELKTKNTPTKKFLTMGYSAFYSGFVHEMIGANFNPPERKGKKMRREGAGAQWLQIAINRNFQTILKIVAETSQIRK